MKLKPKSWLEAVVISATMYLLALAIFREVYVSRISEKDKRLHGKEILEQLVGELYETRLTEIMDLSNCQLAQQTPQD
jgi:hypothetical protein